MKTGNIKFTIGNKAEIESLNDYIDKHGKNKKVELIEKRVIESKNADAIVKFAKEIKMADIKALEDALIKTGNIEKMFSFLKIKGSNTNRLIEEIVKSGNAEDARKLIKLYGKTKKLLISEISFAGKLDIEECKAEIIKLGNIDELQYFYFVNNEHGNKVVINIDEAKELQEKAIKSKNPDHIYYFARIVTGADINALEQALIETTPKDIKPDYLDKPYCYAQVIYKFALLKGVDIEPLQEKVIKSRIPHFIIAFARDVAGANIAKLQLAMYDAKYENKEDFDWHIKEFVEEVPSCEIARLQEVIIKRGKSWEILDFARNVNGADIEKLQKAIIKTRDIKCMKLFAQCVEGADFEKIWHEINKLEQNNFEEME